MVNGVNVSRDLLWLLTSNNNNHMFKRKGIRKRFTTDPLNPKGVQTLRHSGSVQPKAVSIEPAKKGIVLVYRKRRDQNKPAKTLARVTLARDARRSMRVIKKFCNSQFYRRDLKYTCLRRASALLRSQRQTKTVKFGKRPKAGKKD